MTPNEYRKKYKRCRTCKYWKWNSWFLFGSCKVKRTIKTDAQGRFCRVYKAREFKE